MTYRKVEIDGQTYEYSIGRTHTKVRGLPARRNEEIVEPNDIIMYNDLTDEFEVHGKEKVQIKPSDVVSFIKKK